MSKNRRFFGRKIVVGVSSVVVAASNASAASIIDVSTMVPDTTMVGTLGTAIVTALLGIWGIRKVIKLVNRS